ncbi:MAG: calcium/sodium antiporter [Geminicoccaceae bacterium]
MALAAMLVAGLLLLLIGGDLLVRGSVRTALALGVSPLLIGLTLVGFGTSAPELLTSVQAALLNAPGIAVGNVVGSNIANVLLILGLAASLRAIPCARGAFTRDAIAMAVAAVLFVVLAMTGNLSRVDGTILLLALAAYLVVAWRTEQEPPDEVREATTQTVHMGRALLIALAGLVGILVGARLLVTGAIDLAELAGVDEALIGLTVVAIGTSLPELAASLAAVRKKQGDVAFGNVIGSTIFNLLSILGITALVKPLAIPASILDFDLWVMLAVIAMIILMGFTQARISRWEGALCLLLYAGYITALAHGY